MLGFTVFLNNASDPAAVAARGRRRRPHGPPHAADRLAARPDGFGGGLGDALIWTDQIAIWHILVAAFFTGLGQAFGGPAYQALIPSLVDRKDVPNAIALMSIQFNLAGVVGRAIGGFAFETSWRGLVLRHQRNLVPWR